MTVSEQKVWIGIKMRELEIWRGKMNEQACLSFNAIKAFWDCMKDHWITKPEDIITQQKPWISLHKGCEKE